MPQSQSSQATHGAEKPSGTKPRPETPLRRRVRQLWWRLHWLAPNVIPGPHPRDDAYRRAHDEESNRDTRLPAEEELRIRAVWGTEVFGPNESDRLYGALEKLGWTSGSFNGEGALAWVQQQRTYGLHGGAWYNVGPVVRRADLAKYVGHANHAPLPDEVDYLLVRLHQIVPAVTCIVVCFVLKPEATTLYEHELNLNRSSVWRRARRWAITELDPVHLKQHAIARIRSHLNRMVEGWFGQSMPGFFCSLNQPERFPIAEFVTTNLQDLFAERKEHPYFNWQKIMVNAGPFDVWTSGEIQGLRFSIQRATWPREDRPHLIVNLLTSSVPAELLRTYGEPPSAYIAVTHSRIEGLLGYFAAAAYLTEVAKEIKVMRESMRASKTKRHVLRTIDRIQQFFDQNMGLPAIARELVESAKSRGTYRHDCETFTTPGWKDEQPEEIAESLRRRVQSLATRLLEDESSTREQFEQLSTILSVRESIRAQRRMEWLTAAAFVVGIGSMLAAFAAVPDRWAAEIASAWSALLRALR
ncbi:hypothetical protein [Variovorax sp. ZT4R33]|uniref:hypothetical protein n=1 Tax=Variovorax sp. ZT4R33 TaxID=3443743 RepID=UPI003F46C45F